ncbi:MAG: hypothetical protein ACI97A_003272 [Planctomycetota bacterium]|jgi:uncharacterized protein (TIGR00730 family)
MPTICIFVASSSSCPQKYRDWAENIAANLADQGWDLVFGGSHVGLMALVAETFKTRGRRVTSVIPEEFATRCPAFPDSDEVIRTPGLRVRKEEMAKRADAFLALTGGCGTLDEFNEILTLKHLDMAPQPLVLFNPESYWQPYLDMLSRFDEERFAAHPPLDMFRIATTVDAVTDCLS